MSAAVFSLATAAHAQTSSAPNLVFTISAGFTTGGALWSVPRQLVPALVPPPGGSDTLSIGRRLRPGVTGVLNATYYASPRLGYTLEAGYYGVGSEGRCAVIGPYSADAENKNQKACEATQGAHYPTGVVGFQAGLSWRLLPQRTVSPFMRASAGIGVLGTSYIETFATIAAPTACAAQGTTTCNIFVLDEPSRIAVTWVSTLAAGAAVAMGPGYRLRLEARDFITSLPVARDSTTPSVAQPFPRAKVAMSTRHVLTLTIGMDVVLERRPGRRN